MFPICIDATGQTRLGEDYQLHLELVVTNFATGRVDHLFISAASADRLVSNLRETLPLLVEQWWPILSNEQEIIVHEESIQHTLDQVRGGMQELSAVVTTRLFHPCTKQAA